MNEWLTDSYTNQYQYKSQQLVFVWLYRIETLWKVNAEKNEMLIWNNNEKRSQNLTNDDSAKAGSVQHCNLVNWNDTVWQNLQPITNSLG